MSDHESDHWLARPRTIKLLWRGSAVVLVILVLLDLVVPHHPYFGIEGTFGFGAWYGFAACAALVLIAKLLGSFLSRPDTYYDD